jgi:hypothetical protein
MNLYEGDTLEMDIESVWNIDKFDVVVKSALQYRVKTTGASFYTTCLLNVILINVIICLL